MHAIQLFFNILAILIWFYILNYIIKLEKTGCECAKDWRRDFIKYYIIFIIALLILRSLNIIPDRFTPLLMTIQFVFSVAFITIVFHYINDLKVKKCACSQDTARDVLEIFNYIQIFLLAFIFVMMVYMMFTFQSNKTLKA